MTQNVSTDVVSATLEALRHRRQHWFTALSREVNYNTIDGLLHAWRFVQSGGSLASVHAKPLLRYEHILSHEEEAASRREGGEELQGRIHEVKDAMHAVLNEDVERRILMIRRGIRSFGETYYGRSLTSLDLVPAPAYANRGAALSLVKMPETERYAAQELEAIGMCLARRFQQVLGKLDDYRQTKGQPGKDGSYMLALEKRLALQNFCRDLADHDYSRQMMNTGLERMIFPKEAAALFDCLEAMENLKGLEHIGRHLGGTNPVKSWAESVLDGMMPGRRNIPASRD